MRRLEASSGKETFKPTNSPQIQPLTNFDSPAWQASKMFMRGATLGNYLETPPGQSARASPFPASRIYNNEARRFRPRAACQLAGTITPAPRQTSRYRRKFFRRWILSVTNALAAGLAVIINIPPLRLNWITIPLAQLMNFSKSGNRLRRITNLSQSNWSLNWITSRMKTPPLPQ